MPSRTREKDKTCEKDKSCGSLVVGGWWLVIAHTNMSTF
jgi:hypothetical protein